MMADSRAAMGEYEDVDQEIRSFLAQKRADRYPAQQAAQARPDILHLLESLSRTYGEINAYLKSGNAEALKDTILRSDVKMSLVCETLLETLKATTEGKNQLAAENAKLGAAKRGLEEREAQLRLRVDQLERDLECRSADVKELGRVIQDQKDRMNEYRDETQRTRSDAAVNRTKVQELENLRTKASERLQVYEREMDAVKAIIKEREERIAALMREKRAEEDKNSSIKIRIAECEKMVEVMNKKLESKDLNLSLCNDELSKVLSENKAMRADFEKHKERGAYYEGLYGSLNKQNAYLNAQLSKMLKEAEYSKDGAAFMRKYRRKSKKRKRTISRLEEENARLRKEAAGAADATCVTTVGSESSEAIIKRIEELTDTNRQLRKQIAEAENEKRGMEGRLLRLERDGKRESVCQPRLDRGTLDTRFDTRPPLPSAGLGAASSRYSGVGAPPVADAGAGTAAGHRWGGRDVGARVVGGDYKSDYVSAGYNADTNAHAAKPFHEMFSSPSCIAPLMPALRGRAVEYPKPNLDNNYEDVDITSIPGGFADNTFTGQAEAPLPGGGVFGTNIADAAAPSLFGRGQAAEKPYRARPVQGAAARAQAGVDFGRELAPVTPRELQAGLAGGPVAEEHSAESIKSYHTTSTLKDMIARTDKLQKRFESLEEQLANIKEGNTEERLVDKMRTYSTHCSELNIDSNDSDFI